MSLNEMSLIDAVKKQIKFKFQSLHFIWLLLVGLQMFGILISAAVLNSSTSSSGNVSTASQVYSSTFLMVMTYIWIVITSVYLGLSMQRNIDYTFITTRWSQSIANGIFLIIISAVGAFTAYFGSSLTPLVQSLFIDGYVMNEPFKLLEHLTNSAGIFGYLLLFAAISYLLVSLFQINRFVPPILFILLGSLIYTITELELHNPILAFIYFFSKETSIFVFLLKIIATTVLLFGITWVMSRNKEVV